MLVVNVRDYGGVFKAIKEGVVYVGRPGALGNPFVLHNEEGRQTAIDSYRRWLYERLSSGDQAVIAALEALREHSIIGCWCKPLACHGDVIVSAWKWWMGQKHA